MNKRTLFLIIIRWLNEEKVAFYWLKTLGVIGAIITTMITLFFYYIELNTKVEKLEHTVATQDFKLNYIKYKDLREHFLFLWIESELKIDYTGPKAREWRNYLVDSQRFHTSKINLIEYDDKVVLEEPGAIFLPSDTYIISIKEKADYLKQYDITKLNVINHRVGAYYDLSFSLFAMNLYKNELLKIGGLYEPD